MADVSELKSGSKESEIISEPNENSDKNTADLDKEEKLDEDVPEDFFDDFLKEDFMAGLDIVDEDNDLEETNETNKPESKSKEKDSTKVIKIKGCKDTKKILKVKKPKESPSVKLKNAKKTKKQRDHDSELEKLDKELEKIRHAPLKRQETSGVDADNFDIRRDPEKTRQAIQRDKIKSAKDKEKRLITDIVETGLVPPGMELEVDIKEVCQPEKVEHITDLRQKIRSRKTRSKSCENSKSSSKKRVLPQRRSPTPPKRRRTRTPTRKTRLEIPEESSNGFNRNRSFLKETPNLRRRSLSRKSPFSRRSPVMQRGPLMNRSPKLSGEGHSSPTRRSARGPNWSPTRRRTRSPRRNSPFRRRSRTRSPANRRSPNRRSRSKNRLDNYRRRRNHSFSPMEKGRRRRTRSRTPKKNKKEEKISFLEELVAKLNETHPLQSNIPPMAPPINYFMPSQLSQPPPVITPVPPVVQQRPMPASFFPPVSAQAQPMQTTTQKYDPYDESFFIGNAAPLTMSHASHFGNETSNQMDSGTSQPSTLPNFTSDKDVAKLFGDKRIKLSDFLAITAKPQVSNASSAKLQEKIKVIQRCQHAVKILNERKFTGPLAVQKTDSYELSKDKTVSPLLRKPIVQLPFTTPDVRIPKDMDFAKCCQILLHRVGIEKKLVTEMKHENEKLNIVPPKEVTQKDPPPLILHTKQYSEKPPIKVINKSLGTQTDKELSSCKECLRRKGILYVNSAVQAGSPMVTFSVSTQVNEADFYSMIPRTQSLASLTPAQLLGKQSMITNSSNYDHSRINRNMGPQDNIPRVRQVPSPPLPPVFHFTPPNESSYPPPLFSQPSLSSILQARSSIPPNKLYNKDDRWGGFNKRY